MTSRERMRAALRGEPPDHVPCSFMLYHALYQRCASERRFVERQGEMGLDACVHVGHLNPEPHRGGGLAPEARMTEWVEEILVKPERDLDKLRHLFGPIRAEDVRALREEAAQASRLARELGLLSMDRPDLAAEYALVHEAGRLFGYIITSAFGPVVDDIIEAWKRYRA